MYSDSMRRQLRSEILQLLKERTSHHSDIKIRILTPPPLSSDESLEEKIERVFESYDSSIHKSNISIRNIEPSLSTKSTILIVDRKECLLIEVKDDSKETFTDSVGFGTYSNSLATVLSYVSIFESFWSQSEFIRKLKESKGN
ncbi:MAG: hypothetical protein WA667_24675 [Candidatus Nitrosopolaris sp.]